MFEEQAPQRHADAREIVDFVTKRLATIFARVEGPKLLHLRRPDQASAGTALYALYFAVSNPGVRAAQLACGIAHDVLASLD